MRRWIRETHNQTLCRMQMILWGDSYTSITLVPMNAGPIPETCVVLIPCLGRSHSTHSSLDLKDNQKWMKFLKFRLSPAGQVQFTVPSHSLEVNYQKPVTFSNLWSETPPSLRLPISKGKSYGCPQKQLRSQWGETPDPSPHCTNSSSPWAVSISYVHVGLY